MSVAIGVDIGGTGVKVSLVDLLKGEPVGPRLEERTPQGGAPTEVAGVVARLVAGIGVDGPIGVSVPAVVARGVTRSAANISDEWIGLDSAQLFSDALGRDLRLLNDADAAGIAESRLGAAKDSSGRVLVATLGTGIGSALIDDGRLIANTELGHLEVDGRNAEQYAAFSAKARHDLDWDRWATRLNQYFGLVETILTPDLIVIGGGASAYFRDFGHLLEVRAPVVPARYRNDAGIVGSALHATM